MGSSFDYDRTFTFDVAHEVLWSALNDTEHYPKWWPWLRSFEANEPTLVPGTAATCAVRAVPFRTRSSSASASTGSTSVAIDTTVTGDLEGPARLEIAGDEVASSARLIWSVDLRLPLLSAVSRFTRPALTWAHDRVVSTGVEQFREHLSGGSHPTHS